MTRALTFVLGLLTVSPGLVSAQGIDTLPELPAGATVPSPHVIRWWHGAAAVGGLSMLMLLDHPVQRFAVDNASSGTNDVSSVVRHFGQPGSTRP